MAETQFVIVEPLYRENRVFAVCSTLKVAKDVMCDALGISLGKFEANPSEWWWTKQTRSGGIVVHTIGSVSSLEHQGWVIEEHQTRTSVKEVLR